MLISRILYIGTLFDCFSIMVLPRVKINFPQFNVSLVSLYIKEILLYKLLKPLPPVSLTIGIILYASSINTITNNHVIIVFRKFIIINFLSYLKIHLLSY